MAASTFNPYCASNEDALMRRDALVLEGLPQVRLIAKRIHDRLPSHISLDDLISTGVVGLLAAIDHFDPSMNLQLNTYAERRIRGAILDSLREMDWAPRDTRKRAKQIEAAIDQAKQRWGREPSEEEIASELHVPLADYHQWLATVQGIQLQRLEYAGEDGQKVSLLRIGADDRAGWPSNVMERAELERILATAIERIPKLERTILNLYYYEELSLNEISKIVKFHLSRVAQLRVQAVLRLRSHMQRIWPRASRRIS